MLDGVPCLRHLQVLEAVARLNSITRASSEIHLTQPAVTQTIAKLEARTGARLFIRRMTGTFPTPAGELYLQHARKAFRGIEEALRLASPDDDPAALSRRLGKITRAQVRALIAMSQSQSQAQAAALLGISQASLHRAARDLERNVGATLYHRATTGVITTETGHVLAARLELAFNELDEVSHEIQETRITSERCIRIGALVLDPATLLGSVMVEFTELFPDTMVKVVHAPFDVLRQRLRSGALDFMVGVLKSPAEDLMDDHLFDDPYVIVGRRAHPLLRQASVSPEDLLKFDWIVSNQSAPRHGAFLRLFGSIGQRPSTTIETHSLATIRTAIAYSDRLTLLTHSEFLAEQPTGIFAALACSPVGPAPSIGVTSRRGWSPCAEKQAFLELLHRHASSMEAARLTETKIETQRSLAALRKPYPRAARVRQSSGSVKASARTTARR